ncbi:MAG TPA: ATP-binding protein [Stenotrophomonas sp.]|jgi:two-component system sensor histidine kinase RegB
MDNSNNASFLRTLCSLRWLATAGQAATILVATWVLGLALPQPPLWAGVAALALFNLYAQWRVGRETPIGSATAFAHVLVDVAVLTWMVGWSGGIANPFGSLFLILIALAALALPLAWGLAVAAACVAGYGASALFGLPLPHGPFDPHTLHLWGVAANFLLSSVVVLVFSTRLALSQRARESELSMLRERFARNEGIVALATHAASVAHELNTPLATMTLLVDEVADQSTQPELREDLDTLRGLLVLCHERVLALAAPADGGGAQDAVSVQEVLAQWRLVRPSMQLHRNLDAPMRLRLEPGVGHLLMVLLNNAGDAGERTGRPRVDLELRVHDGQLLGEVRDYGAGFDNAKATLPGTLFDSGKPRGMGVGLALSHATVERLAGELWMQPAPGTGTRVGFRLPLPVADEPLQDA